MNSMRGITKHWFPAALVTIVIIITLIIWKPWGNSVESLPILWEAADFELEGTAGETVTLSEHSDKVRLVYFFFSHCPDICIPTTAMLSKVQDELQDRGVFGTETMLYSISFDPDRDTRERLKSFSEGYQADSSGWKFLRGTEQAIKDLAQQYKISVIKDSTGNFLHQNIFSLVDKDGNVRKLYNAGDPEVVASGTLIKEIANDMEQLAK
jgi:protein SCO1